MGGGAAELHRAGALGHCAANLSLLRNLALNLARLESGKGSMRGKLNGYPINILSQFTKIHMR